jgi:hypothetical protein
MEMFNGFIGVGGVSLGRSPVIHLVSNGAWKTLLIDYRVMAEIMRCLQNILEGK